MVSLLQNPVRDYAWGSVTAIPELMGEPPTGQPQAEVWMGAHESAPSTLDDGRTLYDAVRADASGVLGPDVAERFDGRFPFLAKLLAAAQPLSIQAHPSLEQARAGFALDEAAGIPLDAPDRNYRDGWPKPEMLVALSDSDALVGFRPLARTVALLEALDCAAVPELSSLVERLREGRLRDVFIDIMSTDRDTLRPMVAALGICCKTYDGDELALEVETLDQLALDFPDDPGVLAALLLNRVTLRRFEAVYLPAGNVHAYLSGVGFEVMANSDNVLRGGLTRKHVDVRELVSVVDFSPLADPVLRPISHGPVSSYPSDSPYFAVQRVDLGGAFLEVVAEGPRIVACINGSAELEVDGVRTALGRGRSAFVSGPEGPCNLRGSGTVFVVSTP